MSLRFLGPAAMTASLLFGLGAPAARAADDASESEEAAPEESASGDEGEAGDAAEEDGAPDESASKTDSKRAKEDDDFGHQGQVGLRVSIIGGYRMVLRYDDSPYCVAPDPVKEANDQQKFCGHPAPLALGFGLSFGVFDFLEPFGWARLGLAPEKRTDTEPLVLVGAGVRIYTMSNAAFKIFIEPALGFELEGGRGTAAWQRNQPEYKTDFVVHLAAGPSLDFSRNFGAFATAGITTGVLRSLHSALDIELGLQGRYP